MHKICVYCLLKARPGVLKVSLRIYLVFGFFRCYLAFLRVDLAVFAYDYLATLPSLHTRGRSRASRLTAGLYKIGLIFLQVYSLMPDDRLERKKKGSSKNRNAMWKTYY